MIDGCYNLMTFMFFLLLSCVMYLKCDQLVIHIASIHMLGLFVYVFFRVLAQFAFQLSEDWELPRRNTERVKVIKRGIRDMLVKHHLFSWDIN